MSDLPHIKRSIMVGDEKVVLDSSLLVFNEANLARFQENVAIYVDYFGQKLSDMEHQRDLIGMELEEIYAKVYVPSKEDGCTEPLAMAKAKANPDWKAKSKKHIEAKAQVKQLMKHLGAWDRAHDNAASRGHTLRKEMGTINVGLSEQENAANDIVGGA